MTSKTGFDLDISGVAGFFGADVALSAIKTVHVYPGRRWLGWFNQPGSYEVARRYGQLAQSKFWDALYPGPDVDPAILCKFDGKERGPTYTSVHSGTVNPNTGYVARLLLEECQAAHPCQASSGRMTTPEHVAIVRLPECPVSEVAIAQLPQTNVMKIVAVVPILFSLTASTACALLGDWSCCSMILLGMACNGVACYVIGSAPLEFTRPATADGGTYGAGILDGGKTLVVLMGQKDALNTITRGRFVLNYASRPEYHDMGVCSILLSLKLLAQLLVVPQGNLYGQLLFLGSLAVSWAHNSYLSSTDIAVLLRTILLENVLGIKCTPLHQAHSPDVEKGTIRNAIEKYKIGTRSATVVFVLLVLAPYAQNIPALRQRMDDLLANNTELWTVWKTEVLRNIEANLSVLRSEECGIGKMKFDFPAENQHGEVMRQ
ncbi:hypothetical protein TRAPUB_9964 [Trametes pubescens]|uniref:Uncharacterized protein n=1 Tax=Trametes pubescens TaxID=154538 RepID=A0A1M2W0V2_TRAPU|nr:hypothetical protein TRAPUB_9964 [Trametes pubescens]